MSDHSASTPSGPAPIPGVSALDDGAPLVAEIALLVAQEAGENLSRVLTRIVETAVQEIVMDGGSAFLFNYDADEAYVSYRSSQVEGAVHTIRQKIGAAPSTEDLQTAQRALLAGEASSETEEMTVLAEPLRVGARKLGVLGIRTSEITRGREALLRTLANYAVIALEVALRSAGTKKLVYALSHLYESSKILAGVKGVERLLPSIAEDALAISGADFVVLYEYFAENGDVRIPPATAGDIRMPEVLAHRGFIRSHQESIVFKVLNRAKPFFAESAPEEWVQEKLMDLADAREDSSFFAREEVVSSCGIPLLIDAEPVGVLFANYRRPAYFPIDLQERLQLFANQAAIAIGNARFFLRSDRYSRNLAVLNEIGRELAATANLGIPQIAKVIHEQASRVLDTRNFFLCLYSEAEQQYALRYIVDQHDCEDLLQGRLHEGLTGYVVRTREALLATPEVKERIYAEGKATLVGSPSKIWLGAPMILRGEVLGVIVVQSYEDEEAYSEEHRHLLSTIASQAAIAIDNYRHDSFRRTLIDSGPHAIIAVDEQGSITEFNEASESLLGYSKAEISGTEVPRLYWGGFDEARRIRSLLEEQKKFRYVETFVRSKHGEKIPIHLSAALLKEKGEEREVMGSVGIMEDLRLAALHGRIRRLVDAVEKINSAEGLDRIFDSIVLHGVSLLGGDAGCLLVRHDDTYRVKANLECESSCLEELEGDAAQVFLAGIVDGGQSRTFRLGSGERPRLSQESRSSVVVPLAQEARPLAVLVVESRETDHFSADPELIEILASQAAAAISRVQLAEHKERTQRGLLVSANAIAVGQIATSFIHEAKNSLNGMAVTVSTLGQGIEREPGIKAKKRFLQMIAGVVSEIRRLDDLARRLQRFTRQGLKAQKRQVYPNEIVERTLQLLDSALEEKKISCTKRLDSSLNLPSDGIGNPIYVDESQIQQVLMNLILNAIAASPARGRLLIETRDHTDEVEFRVIDYGKGIPEEDRGNIFDPFFTTKEEGTGLGLYISRILVSDNHGGRIEIGSSGKGSIFSVLLPKRE